MKIQVNIDKAKDITKEKGTIEKLEIEVSSEKSALSKLQQQLKEKQSMLDGMNK